MKTPGRKLNTDYFDIVIIGAGLLGCFAARNVKSYDLSVAVFEKEEDVCLKMSKANTAVVYAGYDNRPGSLKAQLCVKGNRNFERLCEELDVPFSRCGSLMLAFGEDGDKVLKKKLRHGCENNVPGLKILDAAGARELERELGDGITSALYSPTTGTVNPWELAVAAYENALDNGAVFCFGEEVVSVENNTVKLRSGKTCKAKIIIDCSGLNAGRLAGSRYHLSTDGADYLVIDRKAAHKPHMVIFEQSETKCRGITAVPTVEGSLLLGPTHRQENVPGATCAEGLEEIKKTAGKVLPGLELDVIRTFAATRPYIETDDAEDVHDFVIDRCGSVISLIGIKTPGLTCADEIGKYLASVCAGELGASPNPLFHPERKAIIKAGKLSDEQRNKLICGNPDYGQIVCLCEDITKAEIIEAVKRGARTIEGVKHRCGTGMGHCQGTRCAQRISEILEEYHA